MRSDIQLFSHSNLCLPSAFTTRILIGNSYLKSWWLKPYILLKYMIDQFQLKKIFQRDFFRRDSFENISFEDISFEEIVSFSGNDLIIWSNFSFQIRPIDQLLIKLGKSGTFVSLLACLGPKSSVLRILLCPNFCINKTAERRIGFTSNFST